MGVKEEVELGTNVGGGTVRAQWNLPFPSFNNTKHVCCIHGAQKPMRPALKVE